MDSSDSDNFTQHTVSIDRLSDDEIEDIAQACAKLFDLWCISDTQKIALLGLDSIDELQSFESMPIKLQLISDQLVRLSMIMNIHQSLSVCFANPENRHGFMTMKNENIPFVGQSPIELATKDFDGLVQTFKAIDGMEHGTW